MLHRKSERSSDEIDQRDIARRDRIIGDILSRLNQIEITLTRQQEIIDAAIDAATRGVRP